MRIASIAYTGLYVLPYHTRALQTYEIKIRGARPLSTFQHGAHLRMSR